MRILLVCPDFPWPIATGGRARLYNLIKALRVQGHDIGLISFFNGAGDPEPGAEELLSWLSDVRLVRVNVPHSFGWRLKRLFRIIPLLLAGVPPMAAFSSHAEVGAALDELTDQYDAVVFSLYFTAFNISRDLWARAGKKLSLVEDDISFIPLARRAAVDTWPHKLLSLFWAFGGKRAEVRMLRRFSRVFAMSEVDRKLAAPLAPKTTFLLSPNGVDCQKFKYRPRPPLPVVPFSLVFVGGLAHYPNLDALRHFTKSIWPEIRRRLPGTTLDVIGSTGGIDTASMQVEGVRFLGFVPDIDAIYAKAAATVTPFRIGGGTRLKILEAMAVGLPVISTAIGIEGIPAQPEHDYLLAETPEDYAAALERLAIEPGLAARLSENGRRLMEQKFDWPIIAASLARDISLP